MQTIVITGANAGLGFETALKLAGTGARIVMACRSMERARAAEKELLSRVPDARTMVVPLDVTEPDSIRALGRVIAERAAPLDVLINNAGIVAMPMTRTRAGHELQLATNYLGAFAVTGTLLPLFRTDAPARIVNVGSLAHQIARLDLDDLNWERTPYNEWKSYARSKLALIGFTMELDRRLRRRGSNVVALAAHPGIAATDIASHKSMTNPTSAVGQWLSRRIDPLIPRPDVAALSIVHAACGEAVEGGEYYGPNGFLGFRGMPGRARLNPAAKDAEVGRRLWALSESMTGVRYLSDADGDAAS